MLIQLIDNATRMYALGVMPEAATYAYYLFLMAIGSLIAWRVG
jgi:hypothetical protein